MNPTMNLEEAGKEDKASANQDAECLACAKISTPTSATCKKCISATPAFNEAVNSLISTKRDK